MKFISILLLVFLTSANAEDYTYTNRYGNDSYDHKPVDGPYYSPNGVYIGQVYGGPTYGGYQAVPQRTCENCNNEYNTDDEGDE